MKDHGFMISDLRFNGKTPEFVEIFIFRSSNCIGFLNLLPRKLLKSDGEINILPKKH